VALTVKNEVQMDSCATGWGLCMMIAAIDITERSLPIPVLFALSLKKIEENR
jgi:hypothetical protein